jgi:hypothetical protein
MSRQAFPAAGEGWFGGGRTGRHPCRPSGAGRVVRDLRCCFLATTLYFKGVIRMTPSLEAIQYHTDATNHQQNFDQISGGSAST